MMGGWGRMMGGWGNGGYGYGGYGGWYGWMSIMPLIFMIGIALLMVYLFRRSSSKIKTAGFREKNNALDILRERYARGEIDTAEYQSRKQDLEK